MGGSPVDRLFTRFWKRSASARRRLNWWLPRSETCALAGQPSPDGVDAVIGVLAGTLSGRARASFLFSSLGFERRSLAGAWTALGGNVRPGQCCV